MGNVASRQLRHGPFRCHSLSLSTKRWKTGNNMPIDANLLPRPGGIATFMRLPYQLTADGLDVCFFGVPMDCGTCNRSGTRYGPRQIRCESTFLRPYNSSTGVLPFDHLNVADIGDTPIPLYDIQKCVISIKNFVQKEVLDKGCIPLTMGGDHTITYPLLQAIKEKHGPVGLVHIDAHPDTNDTMMGCKIAHGTTFRRAVEEGLLDLKRVVQIGLRGPVFGPQDYQWGIDQGFRLILAEQCWYQSMKGYAAEIRQQMGSGPIYVSIDIDGLDPSAAPGTGTPEIGGLMTSQVMEVIRGLQGLNIVGGDLVEVSPPYDPSGNTALTAANLLFELLCVLPHK